MSGYELIVGATISDLETRVNAAIAADKTPVGALMFINNQPAQAVQDGDAVTEYAVASGGSPTELKAVVTARLADDLQPSGQLIRHENMFYAPLLANGGEITAYDIVSGSTYTQLGDAVDASGKTVFGDALNTYGLSLQQVITGTPAGGGGGGGGDVSFDVGDPIVAMAGTLLGGGVGGQGTIQYDALLEQGGFNPYHVRLNSTYSIVQLNGILTCNTAADEERPTWSANVAINASQRPYLKISADQTMLINNESVEVGGSTYTFTIVDNVITDIQVV